MKAFLSHFSFEFRTGLRDKTLLLMYYMFPLLFFAMMGLLMGKINPGFTKGIIPSMIIFAVLVSTLLGMPNPLVTAKESGIFRSYKINGVPISSILGIPAITTTLHMIIISIIIVVVSPIAFKGELPVNWGGFILAFIALSVACTGLGLLIGVLSPNGRVSVLAAQMLFIPSMILGGIMMPTSMLPQSLAKVGMLLPSTYAMNAFSNLGMKQEALFNPLWAVVILFAGGILSFILSIYLFQWDNQNISKKRNPLLAVIAFIPYVIGMILL